MLPGNGVDMLREALPHWRGFGDPMTASPLRPTAAPRIGVLALGDVPDGIAARMRDGLAKQGVDVSDGAAGKVDAIVLILPSGEASEPEPDLAAMGVHAECVIPVVFGSRASSWFDSLSQIVRPEHQLDETVRLVARLAVLGGPELVEVNALSSSARVWDAEGRLTSDLLSIERAELALPLASKASQAGYPQADLLIEYALASSMHGAKLQRRRNHIVGIVAVVLTSAIIVALVQTIVAHRAAEEARRQTSVAVSSRLSGIVSDMLSNKPDPDLAWLLAGRAVAEDPSPEAMRVARMVKDAIPPHRSIRLDQVPSVMVTSPAGRIAILNEDHSVDLRDAHGDLLRHLPPNDDWHAIALSNATGSLLVSGGESALINDGGSEGYPQSSDRLVEIGHTVTDAFWLGSSPLLVTEEGLLAVEREAVVEAEVQPSDTIGRLRGADATPDGGRIVVWGSEGVWFADHDGGNAAKVAQDNVVQVVLAEDGSSGYLATANLGLRVVEFPKDEAPSITSTVSTTHGLFRAGHLILHSALAEAVCAITPPANGAARCITAHRGRVAGAGALGPDLGFATVGTDQYLRLWTGLNAGTYALPETNGSNLLRLHRENDDFWGPMRSRLECVATGDGCWAFTGRINSMALVDDAMVGGRWVQTGTPDFIRNALAPDGRYLSMYNSLNSGVTAWVLTAEEPPRKVWETTVKSVSPTSLHALAPDGSMHVAASATKVAFVRADEEARIVNGASGDPVGIVFYGPSAAAVYFDDGSVLHDGEDGPILPGVPVRAVAGNANMPDRLWWITADNALMMSDQGRLHTIVRLSLDLHPIAIRPSGDGEHLAVFSSEVALVIRVADGATLYASASETELGIVQDVAFREGEVWTIDHSGAIRVLELTDDADFARQFHSDQPRQLRDEEATLFQIPDKVK